jgi:hypothetical protein
MKTTTIPATPARLLGLGLALALAACAQDAAAPGPGPLRTTQQPTASSGEVPPEGEPQAQQPGSPVQ